MNPAINCPSVHLYPMEHHGAPWIHHQWMSQHPLAVQVSLITTEPGLGGSSQPNSLRFSNYSSSTQKTLGEEPLLQKGSGWNPSWWTVQTEVPSWQCHFFRTLGNCKPQVFRIRISFHVAPN
jgi:hypothetical protein